MGNKTAKGSKKKKNSTELTEVIHIKLNELNNSQTLNQCFVFKQEEVQLLLSNTSFTREEIFKWHEGFIVSQTYWELIFIKSI